MNAILKAVAIIMVVAMVMTGTVMTVLTAEAKSFDLNGDGKVNVIDLAEMKSMILYDEDADVTVADLVSLKRYLLGDPVDSSVVKYDFSKSEATDENVNVIRNTLSMCGIQSISLTSNVEYAELTVSVEGGYTYIFLMQVKDAPEGYAKEIISASLTEGGTVTVVKDDDGYLKIEYSSNTAETEAIETTTEIATEKVARVIIATSLPETDENSEMLKSIFEGEIISSTTVVIRENKILQLEIEESNYITYLQFSVEEMVNNSKVANKFNFLAANTPTASEVTYQLYSDGTSYQLCAVA